jgi:hypothetical protein
MVALQAIFVGCLIIGFAICGGAALGIGAAIIAICARRGRWQR